MKKALRNPNGDVGVFLWFLFIQQLLVPVSGGRPLRNPKDDFGDLLWFVYSTRKGGLKRDNTRQRIFLFDWEGSRKGPSNTQRF